MILDSSAVLSIVCREAGWQELVRKIQEAEAVGVGAPTLVEVGLVLEARFRLDALAVLDRLLRDFSIAVVAFGDDHWREAIDAYRRYGKGRHPAALNFGDCQSYATAALSGQPLLFVGEDFSQTDVEPA